MPARNKHVTAVRRIALSYPQVEEGTSCNKLSFKAGKKAFLYLGETDTGYSTMLKLTDSYAEAEKLAEKQPEVYQPGNSGWVHSDFPADKAPPAGLMKRWIDESFRALVPKKIVAQLQD